MEKKYIMTPEDLAKAKEWIADKRDTPACPVCRSDRWSIEDSMTACPVYKYPVGTSFGPIYPFVLAICENCGYTEFFNAVSMGFQEGAEEGGQQDGN